MTTPPAPAPYDPDNDGDNDAQPDIDDNAGMAFGYGGWPRPLKSVRQHKHRMDAPGAQADNPPDIRRPRRRS